MALTLSLKQLPLPTLADTPIGAAWHSWRRALHQCLPPAARHWLLQRQAPSLIITPDGEEARLHRQLGTERGFIAVVDARSQIPLAQLVPKPRKGWREIVIELPAQRILTRSITLPAQVRDNLREVVGYELDRLTPFTRQVVYYDVIQTETGELGKRLRADLALCERQWVDPWLERLRAMGAAPTRLTWSGAWARANLLPLSQRPRKSRVGLYISMLLVMLILTLAGFHMASPVWHKERELQELNQMLRQLRADAEQVPAIREELERARAGSLAVLERKAAQPRMIDLLRELTDRLPDHTWVQTLNFSGAEVDLRGESEQATELLTILEQAPGISNVSFRSPVMQAPHLGKERFHLAFTYQRASS